MALHFSCHAAALNTHLHCKLNATVNKPHEKVRDLIIRSKVPSITTVPQKSLQKGNWVKLICGASFEDVVDVRNLSLVYTLAGVDCIDCAADLAVVNAVNEGIDAARTILPIRRPWVMISVNDDEDLHFRKAEFDPDDCPNDCSRPCEKICPANAISFQDAFSSYKVLTSFLLQPGVITERCYGCGRCFPVSLPYIGDSTVSMMNKMYSILEQDLRCLNLWQLDGRPMSGDIGRGATRESIAFALRLASTNNRPPGFLQLAGGTNAHTVDGLRKQNLFQTATVSESSRVSNSNALISGIAYGGYARKIVGRVLQSDSDSEGGVGEIESYPDHLLMAVIEALGLVGGVKSYNM
ncbi:4Fe-4S ferredoxin-type, iron-sulpur binding domain-containing protein [Cynara cardunculus var. scolymus]|uniref:4Fe-4S ferredoxin-type, iron-sulpur binding domain-containing protein n=1 Tax=Cynara cardunculus var. scolymus TaxID=59895 RepID=A0A103XZH6_CYNCS|nr:4Fe-4S ferredoxin-type, iron-sulpur binding domain-containing protein [Cynara cardunculus var. scolymus]